MSFKNILLAFLILFPSWVFSATWKMIPDKSSLTFTATQNNAPVTGTFHSFSGEINFDPNQLNASNIHIVVNMASVTASYEEVTTTLKTSDWFNTKVFPQAIFQTNKITKLADGTYQADGTLTIRNITAPIVLKFSLEEYSSNKALAKGSTKINRTTFHVGEGEWKNTNTIKDEVTINFILAATT